MSGGLAARPARTLNTEKNKWCRPGLATRPKACKLPMTARIRACKPSVARKYLRAAASPRGRSTKPATEAEGAPATGASANPEHPSNKPASAGRGAPRGPGLKGGMTRRGARLRRAVLGLQTHHRLTYEVQTDQEWRGFSWDPSGGILRNPLNPALLPPLPGPEFTGLRVPGRSNSLK